MVGDERERDHADHVRGEGDRHDQHRQRHVAEQRIAPHQVQVQQAQGLQRQPRLQARAGVGHQQHVLPDLQHHPVAADRVTHGIENVLGRVGNGHLHRHGHHVHHLRRQGHHEQHQEQREPLRLQRGPAAQQHDQARQQPDHRAGFEHADALRAADGIEEQSDHHQHPAEGVSRAPLGGRFHGRPVAVQQPQRDGQHDGTVVLVVLRPGAGEQAHQGWHIEDTQAQQNRCPFKQLTRQRAAGRTGRTTDRVHINLAKSDGAPRLEVGGRRGGLPGGVGRGFPRSRRGAARAGVAVGQTGAHRAVHSGGPVRGLAHRRAPRARPVAVLRPGAAGGCH